jgi:mannitol/fructose-specific phosphotransferase system IIA component (Ntr-type)
MTIDEILHPADVNLSLRADGKAAAVEEVLAALRGDERVTNWEELRRAVVERDAPALEHEGLGLCIAHGRTKAVSGLTMAVGVSAVGVECPETKVRVNLLFVVGIPATMDSEYLRLVGAIARVCRDARLVERLRAAGDGERFVELLAEAMARL